MNQPKKQTLLIVEDEAGFRRIYRDIFLHEGYGVLEAEDGETGWTIASSGKPDLILLDLVLPKLHGFEVLEKIRATEETKNIPIILFSVLGRDEDIKKGLGAGANDYIVKGLYSPKEVLAKVAEQLRKSEITHVIDTYKITIVEKKSQERNNIHDDEVIEKHFQCPVCNTSLLLELFPKHLPHKP